MRYRNGLFREDSKRLPKLLNTFWADPDGRAHVEEWMRDGRALDIVCEELETSMEIPKQQLLMRSKDISIAYLTSWSINDAIEHVDVPISWTRILEAVTRSPQSDDNTKKSPTLVRFSFFSFCNSYHVSHAISLWHRFFMYGLAMLCKCNWL